jgi:hypothetical protein
MSNSTNEKSSKPVCAITGTGGFVGGYLRDYFAGHGWETPAGPNPAPKRRRFNWAWTPPPVGAAIVDHNNLTTYTGALNTVLRLFNAAGDCLRFVQTGHDDGELNGFGHELNLIQTHSFW